MKPGSTSIDHNMKCVKPPLLPRSMQFWPDHANRHMILELNFKAAGHCTQQVNEVLVHMQGGTLC